MRDGSVPYWPGAAQLRQAVTDQLAAMGYPTVESHPWRPRITSIGADLSPVTVTPRVVSHIFPKRRRNE
ncbi:hypothetical protein JYU34_012242 [Plutella xylostella]|uniref:Uncharacterized protein n=1 Tax=Plutella xylostella TaxID=51655 RepID=A0ABQ7QEP8_PLUXY|nr:hypothetical protein JYU34_012242 [Plutella xylostella]